MRYATQAAEEDKLDAVAKVTRWVDHVIGVRFHKFRSAETWEPPINLYEDASDYYMVVDLAGVRAEGIDLHIEDRTMTVCGQRAAPRPDKNCGILKMHLMEIDHGPFQRTVKLPENVDTDAIKASYRCGFLWIQMPKRT